jgi:hypothetical protein
VRNLVLELKLGPNYADVIKILDSLKRKCNYEIFSFTEIYEQEKISARDWAALTIHVREFVRPFDLQEKPEGEDFWLVLP